MRTVQTGWEEYYSMAMAVSGVSKDSIQYKETRRAFYAGAALMFELATGMSELSDDAAVEVLKGLSIELLDFSAKVSNKAGGN